MLAGIAIERVERIRHTLEDRFLALTSTTTGGTSMRLTRAALLTLRRRRALMVWAGVLAIGVPARDRADPRRPARARSHHEPPAGGSRTFAHMTDTIDLALVVMAAIVGATAGAGDLSAGTFRDLVASGCPRRSLFLARIPAALAVTRQLRAPQASA